MISKVMMDPALLPRLWVIILRAALKTFAPKIARRHHAHIQRAMAQYSNLQKLLVNPDFDLNLGRKWYASIRHEMSNIPDNLWLPASCWAAIDCWTDCAEKQGPKGYAWLQLARATEPLANSLTLEFSGITPSKGANLKHDNFEILAAASALSEAGTRSALTLWYGPSLPVVHGTAKGPRNRSEMAQAGAVDHSDILSGLGSAAGAISGT